MPEIRVQYLAGPDGRGLRPEEASMPGEASVLKRILREECVRRFSLPDFSLQPSDFDFIDEPLGGASELGKDVIVRISLHDFPARHENGQGQAHADDLAELVSEFLNEVGDMINWDNRRTVGVSLLFAHIEWSSL